jgi:hypothetical protein
MRKGGHFYNWLFIFIIFYALCACGENKEISTVEKQDISPTTSNTSLMLPTATKKTIPSSPNDLYFLKKDNVTGKPQIFMLKSGLSTLIQITNQTDGVFDYDVSQISGDVTFVIMDKLVILQIEDNSIHNIVLDLPTHYVKKTGCCGNPPEDITIDTESAYIVKPRWSPDGKAIAFYKNGVSIYDIEKGSEKIIINNGENKLEYYPYEFSPDSKKILVRTNSKALYVYDLVLKILTLLPEQTILPICNINWSTDSRHILCSQNIAAGGGEGIMYPGLWIYDIDGSVKAISHFREAGYERIEEKVFAPYLNIDNTLLFLYSYVDHTEMKGGDYYYLTYLDSDKIENEKRIRDEKLLIGQSNPWIWTKDGSELLVEQYINNSYVLTLIPTDSDAQINDLIINSESIQKLKWGM